MYVCMYEWIYVYILGSVPNLTLDYDFVTVYAMQNADSQLYKSVCRVCNQKRKWYSTE